MALRVFLTGRLTLLAEGGTLDQRDLPGQLGRGLLGALVLARGPLRRSELAEMLARDLGTSTFDATLNSMISRLRNALGRIGLSGRDWIVANGRTVEFRRVEQTTVDVETAIAASDRAHVAVRRGDLNGAWVDASITYAVTARPFLPNIDGLWVEDRQRELDELRRRSLRIIVEAAIATGDLHHAEAAADRLVRDDPLREDSHRLRIRAFLAAGDRGRAKRALLDLERLLRDELDETVSPETRALLTTEG